MALPERFAGALTLAAAATLAVLGDAHAATAVQAARVATVGSQDLGPVAPGELFTQLKVMLKRDAATEKAYAAFLDSLHDENSPNFHRWLTADETGSRFGAPAASRAQVVAWLRAQGMTVDRVASNGMAVYFSATAAQLRRSLNVDFHRYQYGGQTHLASVTEPALPAALDAHITGFATFAEFHPRAHHQRARLPQATAPVGATTAAVVGGTQAAGAKPDMGIDNPGGIPINLVSPGDFASIYNINPLRKATPAILGTGQTVAVVEDSNMQSFDWQSFREAFGLASYPAKLSLVHPGPGCSDPGLTADESEAALDAEWVTAVAPAAHVVVASCANTQTASGVLLAVENLLSEPKPPEVISVSYGYCENLIGAADMQSVSEVYRQAVAQGISVYVSAGDNGVSECDADEAGASGDRSYFNLSGISVSGLASTPYNIAVGGTDFADVAANQASTYWNSKNGKNWNNAKGYVPEKTWNDSCADSDLLAAWETQYMDLPFLNPKYSYARDAANWCTISGNTPNDGTAVPAQSTTGGGGAGYSQFFLKPSWQKDAYGMSGANVRHLPDVSLFSAAGVWGHALLYCMSDAKYGGAACEYEIPANAIYSAAGGTSFAAPAFAAIQALVNQKKGARQGHPAYRLYALGAEEFGTPTKPKLDAVKACDASLGKDVASSCVFQGVTRGNIEQPCYVVGKSTDTECYYGPDATGKAYPPTNTPVAQYIDGAVPVGITSYKPDRFRPVYVAAPGWNYTTGWGSVNVANLVNRW